MGLLIFIFVFLLCNLGLYFVAKTQILENTSEKYLESMRRNVNRKNSKF